MGIHFRKGETNIDIKAYSYSDWAGCKDSRRSTKSFVVSINNTPISWKSVRQSIVAISSAEAAYIALSTTAKEVTWIRCLCWKVKYQRPFGPESLIPTIQMYSDNTRELSITVQQGSNGRTKHIEVKYHHVRYLRLTGIIPVNYVPTSAQLSDILTKPVDRLLMERLGRNLVINFARI